MKIRLKFFFLFRAFSGAAQGIILQSSVYGDSEGNPLPFANIAVVANSRGAMSDSSGFFTLSVAAGDSVYFSYVGYQPATLAVKDFKAFIILKSQTHQLKPVEIAWRQRILKKSLGFDQQKSSHHFAGPLQYAVFIPNTENKEGVIKTLKFRVSHGVARDKSQKKSLQAKV
jgi:hypothetical protein